MLKRSTFERLVKEVITICGNESYLVSRNRKKKYPADGSANKITQESCRENIRRILIEVVDNIAEPFGNKITAHVNISTKFNYFFNLEYLTDSEITNVADSLQRPYQADLESYIYEELVQFKSGSNLCSGINVAEKDIWRYQFIKNDWVSVFLIIEITLRIYLSRMCSGEIVLKIKSN